MATLHHWNRLRKSQISLRLVRKVGKCAICPLVSVIDQVDDGLSAVYTFFDPARDRDSLGVYGVLWQIELANRLELPYLYLGYWIAESRKMAYKKQYPPLQGLVDGRWQLIAPVSTDGA